MDYDFPQLFLIIFNHFKSVLWCCEIRYLLDVIGGALVKIRKFHFGVEENDKAEVRQGHIRNRGTSFKVKWLDIK